jgi:hypothetical protein
MRKKTLLDYRGRLLFIQDFFSVCYIYTGKWKANSNVWRGSDIDNERMRSNVGENIDNKTTVMHDWFIH